MANSKDFERHRRYWRANNRLILALLVVWGAASYLCGIFLVEPLNTIEFFNIPLGFWIAQQGAIYVFVVLIFLYAVLMDRLDRKHHEDE